MIHGPYDSINREILKALLFSRLNDLTCGIQFDKRAKTKGDLILRLVFMISRALRGICVESVGGSY